MESGNIEILSEKVSPDGVFVAAPTRMVNSAGATLIEYAVLIGLIGIIALGAVQLMGQKISAQLSILSNSM